MSNEGLNNNPNVLNKMTYRQRLFAATAGVLLTGAAVFGLVQSGEGARAQDTCDPVVDNGCDPETTETLPPKGPETTTTTVPETTTTTTVPETTTTTAPETTTTTVPETTTTTVTSAPPNRPPITVEITVPPVVGE